MNTTDRFWRRVRKTETCWLWVGALGSTGYGQFQLDGKVQSAHRASFQLLVGEIPGGSWVLHSCDNKQCVNPAHLRLGDRAANARDAVERRRLPYGDRNIARSHPERMPRGSANGSSRLTEDQVAAIRRLRAAGSKQAELAVLFGVAQSTISAIVSGHRWRHLNTDASAEAARRLDEVME